MTDQAIPRTTGAKRRRLAIIGGGSSGLICLKTAIELLPDWEIVCYERTNRLTGCWGNPYPGFVSTSTKYTTQFSCFPVQDASVHADGGNSRSEFFRDSEYGEYLQQFADAFKLCHHVRLCHHVDRIDRSSSGLGWHVTVRSMDSPKPAPSTTEHYDCVVICTGLAAQTKPIESAVPQVSLTKLNQPGGISDIKNQSIVVFGGGESAVDYAHRLSRPELGNRVYLSLRSGIRVSPRYHPIRGVPSDFLRNRLMLSIHPDIRNWIGQRFVLARIKHQEWFERWFPSKASVSGFWLRRPRPPASTSTCDVQTAKKQWAYKLTKAAKDDLFNMFHNKSDDFLDCVACGRIKIIGPAVDGNLQSYRLFDSNDSVRIDPDSILPAIGYRSTLDLITGDATGLTDFYLGCCHQTYPDLFLVGFARPIIGNIPTISEMQSQYVCGLIGGRYARPAGIIKLNHADQNAQRKRYCKLNLEAVYPVEMFAYCDRLARLMGVYPNLWQLKSLVSWWRLQLAPATTMHYQFGDPKVRGFFDRSPIYMPAALVCLLLMLKPIDMGYRLVRRIRSGIATVLKPRAIPATRGDRRRATAEW